MRYVILQRTPTPGYFQALPTWQIQKAEFDLRLGKYYHERAMKMGRLTEEIYLYTWEDANQILEYWRTRREWAEYRLLGLLDS